MCNAWNHSRDCNCGWGGVGHLGPRDNFGRDGWVGIKFKTYREVLIGATTPNARCPVCGAKVFFYQSPFGGRVFFDELGPPWQKHPCTSKIRQSMAVIRIVVEVGIGTRLPPPVLRDGWMPFLCEILKSVATESDIQKLEGWLDGERKTFYVKGNQFSEGAPFFLKKEGDLWYVSTLAGDSKNVEPKTIRAFVFESELHNLAPPNPQPQQPNSRNRNVTQPKSRPELSAKQERKRAKQKKPRKKSGKPQQNDKSNRPSPPAPFGGMTAMELAMQDAEMRRQGVK
jgi:hypothetical protein